MYSHIVNANVLTPICDKDINETYFQSLWATNSEEFHRVTILSDVLPILLALVHDGKANGQVDICNKGTISLKYFQKLNSNEIKQEDVIPQSIECAFINHWIETYPNDKIINIDRLDPVANTNNISNPNSSNYSLIVADIKNKDIVLHLCNQYNITHIIHFAVQAYLDNSFGNSVTFTESNVYGTHSVLEASRIYGKILKFIHISTDEVYGEASSGSNQEICLLNPLNPYAATIAAAESELGR
ncbi:unnamed protein product, partial [Rotaria socialis]